VSALVSFNNIKPGEHDEDVTVEVRMAMIWHTEQITNQNRCTQIIAKARGLVANFVESHGKYKETPAKARDDMVVATGTEMAKAYVKRQAAKTSSTKSDAFWRQLPHIGRLGPRII